MKPMFSKKHKLKKTITYKELDNSNELKLEAIRRLSMTSSPLETKRLRQFIKNIDVQTKKILKLEYKNVTVEGDLPQYNELKETLINKLKDSRTDNRKVLCNSDNFENFDYKTCAGVHIDSGDFKKMAEDLPLKRITSLRPPFKSGNSLGIEIEFICPYIERNDLAQKFIDAKLTRYCRIMTDNSIDNNDTIEGDYSGWELCIVAPQSKYKEVLSRSLNILDDIGAEVNLTCGLHIHLDMRNRNHKLVYRNLVRVQDILYGLCSNQRRSNQYCYPAETEDWDLVRDVGYRSRYQGINIQSYSKHQTIEVRMHESTLNENKICNWIDLLIKIASYSETLPKFNSFSYKFKKLLNLDEKAVKYIKKNEVKNAAI